MEPTTIGAQSWVAFPVAPLTPTTPDQQKWVAILAGIAVIESQGSGSEWIHVDVRLTLDGLLEAIFTFAQRTPSAGHHLRFVIEHTANIAASNSTNSHADSSGQQQHTLGSAV